MNELRASSTPSTCGSCATDNEEDLSAHALLEFNRQMESIAKDSADAAEVYEAVTQKPTKKRKSSSVVRKEEKAGLLDEIKDLEKRLAFLNGEVFAPLCSSEQVDPNVSNSLLRETVKQQELRFAGARSVLSQAACNRSTPPTQDYLHLGRDPAERRRQLLEIRPTMLTYAHRFVTERFKHMDLLRPYSAEERYTTTSGENIVEFWDLHQVPKARNVREVYEAVIEFFKLSDRTTAINNSMQEDEYVQSKFVMDLERGVQVEHNYVRFGHLDEAQDYAMWACCPVSQDDLSPYSPNERYRRDLTVVMLAKVYKSTVVVARYAHFRLFHARYITASQDVLEQVMIQWNKFLLGWITYIQNHTGPTESEEDASIDQDDEDEDDNDARSDQYDYNYERGHP